MLKELRKLSSSQNLKLHEEKSLNVTANMVVDMSTLSATGDVNEEAPSIQS
jgi:hypothetical protein